MSSKRKGTEEKLYELRELSEQFCSPRDDAKLFAYLKDSSSAVVAKAAELVTDNELLETEALLIEAYQRFLENPLKTDCGCTAKLALLEALVKTSQGSSEFFRDNLGYQQFEPVWGGRVDTAAVLRGTCAFGLAQTASHFDFAEVLSDLAALLCDAEKMARINAALAVGAYRHEGGIALLRLKVLQGDTEGEVIAKCFSALLDLNFETQQDFVREHLVGTDSRWKFEAASALSESSDERAVSILCNAHAEGVCVEFPQDLLRFIGLCRQRSASEFLLSVLENAEDSIAEKALEALEPQRFYDDICAAIQKLIEKRDSHILEELYETRFSPRN